MIWATGMLAILIEHYLVICDLCNGGSWESQTLEEVNSIGQNYDGVGPDVDAHESQNKQKEILHTLHHIT